MDAEYAKWLITQGIGATLALIMFLVYRKDVHNALNSWQTQTKVLTELVQTVSTTIQANTDAVRAMQGSLPHACPMVDSLGKGDLEIVTRQRAR